MSCFHRPELSSIGSLSGITPADLPLCERSALGPSGPGMLSDDELREPLLPRGVAVSQNTTGDSGLTQTL